MRDNASVFYNDGTSPFKITITHPLLDCIWMTWQSCSRLQWPVCSTKVNRRGREDEKKRYFSVCVFFITNIHLYWYAHIWNILLGKITHWTGLWILTISTKSKNVRSIRLNCHALTWLPGLTRRRAASAHKCAAVMTSAFLPVTGAS